MELALFWLPIIGGILLGGFAAGAWYAGHKSQGLWLSVSGLICFLLVVALQIQQHVWASDEARTAEPRSPEAAAQRAYSAVGMDTTIVGTVPSGGVGDRSTVVNMGDGNGNVIFNRGGTAIGAGATADAASIAIGSGAHAGGVPPASEQK